MAKGRHGGPDINPFAGKDEPLEILRVKSQELQQGTFAQFRKRYRVNLELNRYPHEDEANAIVRNPFFLQAKVHQWFIVIDNTTLERIEKIAIRFNQYIHDSSQKALERRAGRLSREARADAIRKDRELRLSERASRIRFK